MGKPLQIVTIALAISIATFIQAARAHAANDVECVRKSHSSIGFTSVRAFDAWFPRTIYPVSYTHLTLPTIVSV